MNKLNLENNIVLIVCLFFGFLLTLFITSAANSYLSFIAFILIALIFSLIISPFIAISFALMRDLFALIRHLVAQSAQNTNHKPH